MYIIVAGGGKVGFHLAQELIQSGNEVLILEREASRVAQIAEELDPKGEVLRRQELEVVVRFLYPEQVITMCERVGLNVIEMWGDFEGGELDEESDEIVVLARHAE